MRIAIFGGSFDPVHNGHVNHVKQMIKALSLDKVIVVVANISPHKVNTPPHVSVERRLDMAKLAFEGVENIEISSIEMDRGGVSYTIETVETVVEAFQNEEIFLLIAEDGLKNFDSWKRAEDIESLINVVFAVDEKANLNETSKTTCSIPWIHICSTEIRKKLYKEDSCKEYISLKVLDYIAKHQLYSKAYDNG